MGRGFVEYHWPAANHRTWITFSAFLHYRLRDGSTLPVEQQPAWCATCRDFRLADDALLRLALAEQVLVEALNEIDRRIDWRRTRIGPARCLECGSSAITPIPCAGTFAHPATGEPVSVVNSGFAVTPSWQADFSSEGGNLIPVDSKRL
jgi:hypothetical protein